MDDFPARPHTNGTAEAQQDAHPRHIVLTDSSVNEEEERERRKTSRRRTLRKAPPWIEAGCAIALVVITFFYTYYAKKQRDTMIQTYTEMQNQTRYFKDQTTLLSQQMEGYMAAVVWGQMQYDNGGNGLFFQVINTGHIMSPKVTVDLSIYRHSYPVPAGVKAFEHFHQEITQLPVTPSRDGSVRFDDGYMFKILPPIREQYDYVAEGTLTFATGFNDHILSQHICYASTFLPGYLVDNGRAFDQVGPFECRSYRNVVQQYWESRRRYEKKP